MFFLSHYIHSVDSKGRVSIPSKFRGVMKPEETGNFIAYPSLHYRAIEVSGVSFIGKLHAARENVLLSGKDDALLTALFATASPLPIDRDGRVVLLSSLKRFASIVGEALFVGIGERFLIWEPEEGKRFLESQRQRAFSFFLTEDFPSRVQRQEE